MTLIPSNTVTIRLTLIASSVIMLLFAVPNSLFLIRQFGTYSNHDNFSFSENSDNGLPLLSVGLRRKQNCNKNLLGEYLDPNTIRKWGCHRNETPTIFVHLGKAGGGTTRARFAAATQDYNRTRWFVPEDDEHYYPVPNDYMYGEATGPHRRARFCNSKNQNYVIPTVHNTSSSPFARRVPYGDFFVRYTFEGSKPCHATTPLGLAVACPQHKNRLCEGCDLNSDHCDTVYVGHNYMGSELHWLPPRYLKNWWKDHWVIFPLEEQQSLHVESKVDDMQNQIERTWLRLGAGNSETWCEDGRGRKLRRPPVHAFQSNASSHYKCASNIAQEADEQFHQFWRSVVGDRKDWSPIYASMPLHRTTVIREPWSWIGSKFFWHGLPKKGIKCYRDLNKWVPGIVQEYLMPFCGVDCESRFERELMTLDDVAMQAIGNLRHSFSVVGLLNETQQFYDMVSARIEYLDMNNNPHVQGDAHTSESNSSIVQYCKNKFQDPKFQEKARQKHPELALMERVYQAAVEVNRFQQEELNQCGQAGVS